MRKKIKVFDIKYLVNEEYTEDDLFYLFDTPSLLYSLINYEFELIGHKHDLSYIKRIVKSNGWQYKYTWTTKQINEFEKNVQKIFKKLYCIGDNEALANVQIFVINFGLTNSKIQNKKANIL